MTKQLDSSHLETKKLSKTFLVKFTYSYREHFHSPGGGAIDSEYLGSEIITTTYNAYIPANIHWETPDPHALEFARLAYKRDCEYKQEFKHLNEEITMFHIHYVYKTTG